MTRETDRGAQRRAAPPILQNAFRPFFLGGAIWAAIQVPLWYAEYAGYLGYVAGPAGHAHEMLYGMLAAIICGFALTAIPNWTGRAPVAGAGLAALFALWLAGRLGMIFAGHGWGMAIDLVFLPVFTLVVLREIISGRNWRNLPVAVMVVLFTFSHFAFHWPEWSGTAIRATFAVTLLLVALIGGRIVPSFTRNWLAGRDEEATRRVAPPMQGLDKMVLALTGLALALWIVWPESAATGGALGLAAIAQLIRLLRWQGVSTLGEPLMWSLHAGYLWMVLALAIMAAGIIWPEQVPAAAGLHAIGAGVIGGMTLAVMTRASLGHTGRERIANRATTLVFVLVHAGALLRVAAAILLNEPRLLGLSAILWSGAFGLFAIAYIPVLFSARRT
ncbi:NnrS family protein [Hyphobacterium sp. HN65]|uniref:NnrS family protein n=1 Tax=Hyphobacterium lacteum TaxID=3116575 RepID=A0ABU7LP56_9PROT|nr:NnrS family protein [Hyphobacterium sp. HN65]MEE2525694.1 NnrS family protein [Hyphobacterium sp. HN65]